MMGGSCVGLGGILGTFQAAGSKMLNTNLIKPKPLEEKPDAESPLLGTTQERRTRFFKVRDASHARNHRQRSRRIDFLATDTWTTGVRLRGGL